ncbi:MAG: DMT family transporter [Chloroflexota bacterium]
MMVLRSFLHENRSLGLLLLLSLLWGSSYLWINVLNQAFNPAMVMLIRVAMAGLVLLPLARMRGIPLPRFGHRWGHILIVAITADLIPLALLVWSQQYVTSSVAAVLNATVPLFTLLIAALIFRNEYISLPRLIGIVLAFAGVVLLSRISSEGPSALLNPGIIAMTLSSVFYGFGFVYARRYVRGEPFAIVSLQMIFSLALVLPFAVLIGRVDTGMISPTVVLAILALGGLSGGVGYCAYYLSLDRLGPTMTSYATYLSPVVAIALGWAVLGERIAPVGFLGIAIIVSGVFTAAGGWTFLVQKVQKQLAPIEQPIFKPELLEDWSIVA